MNARLVLSLIALSLAVCACGNKGPLVLPTKPVPVTAPAQPAGEVPVQMAPEATPPSLPHKSAEPAPAEPATDDAKGGGTVDPTPPADGGR